MVDEFGAVDPIHLTTVEKQSAMVDLARERSRLEAIELRILACSDDVAVVTGARSAAVWVADQTRQAHGVVRRDAVLAEALGSRWGQVSEALGAGAVNVAQARVLVEALDALPADLGDDLRDQGGGLPGRPGQGIRAARAAPAGPRGPGASRPRDRRSGRLPAAAGRGTARTGRDASLSFTPRGDGSTDVHARLPDHVASRLRTYLEAFTSPRRTPLGDVDALPVARRRGEAFCALLENLPDTGLPAHGGSATSVMVTLDLDALVSGLGAAESSTGDRVTAEQARRLACQARIIPVVLGRQGEVLDLGRSARLFSPAQRKAMALRDQQCTADVLLDPRRLVRGPPLATALGDRRTHRPRRRQAVCSFHHHRAHDPGWHDAPPRQRIHHLPPADVTGASDSSPATTCSPNCPHRLRAPPPR